MPKSRCIRIYAINITERKKTEEVLAYQANLLSNARDAIFGVDSKYNITYWNKCAEDLLGYTKEEAVGKNFQALIPIKIENSTREEELAKQEAVGHWEGEVQYLRKDGSYVSVELNSSTVRSPNGDLQGVITTARDITERKKAEEVLLKAKEQTEFDRKRLETILETTPSAVVIIEANTGKFSYVNKRAAQLYGFDTVELSLDENVAKVKARRVDGTEYPIEEMPLSRSLKFGQEVYNQEMIIERADGQVIPIVANTGPLRDMQGNITAAIVVFDDITERKKAEKALERQAELIDLSPDAIIVQQLNGTITFWSKGAEKLYGWTRNEAIGQDIHTLLMSKFPHPLEEILEKVKLDGKWSGELTHKCKDGEKLIVQSYWLGKFGGNGKIESILESNVDISARIQLQL